MGLLLADSGSVAARNLLVCREFLAGGLRIPLDVVA